MSTVLFKEYPLLCGGSLLCDWFKLLSFDALFDPGVVLCSNYRTKMSSLEILNFVMVIDVAQVNFNYVLII